MIKLFFILLLIFYSESLQNIGSVIHISDIHLDLQYKVGSPTQCVLGNTGLGCCRETSIPINGSTPASKWGSYNCDTTQLLMTETIRWIANLTDIDAIIWTGDVVDHHDLTQSWAKNYNELKSFTQTIQTYLRTPIFPVLGNHDTYPIDQLYPNISSPVILGDVYDLWKNFSINSTFRSYGFYTYSFTPNIQIIALNSLYWDQNNLALKFDKTVAEYQWDWLNLTLQSCRERNQSVWILQHIAPGSGEALPDMSSRYEYIVSQYTDLHISHFAGHSHDDEFRLLHDTKNNVIGAVFIPLSVKPDFHYPGVRRVFYDRDTGVLLDYEQYWMNWTRQLSSEEFLGYDLAYRFTSEYGVTDLSATQLNNLVQSMKQDDKLFYKYYLNNEPNNVYEPCDQSCKKELICDMEWVDKSC